MRRGAGKGKGKWLDNCVSDLPMREIGAVNRRSWERQLGNAQDFVFNLRILQQGVFEFDEPIMTLVSSLSLNSTGDLLLGTTFSDVDGTLGLWNWKTDTIVGWFQSDGTLKAKFIPSTVDSFICYQSDGEVIHAQIQDAEIVDERELYIHEGGVADLAFEPGNPHIFYSCGGDGSVRKFDLRSNISVSFTFGDNINVPDKSLRSIALDPREPNLFAVAGYNKYVRLYDARRVSEHTHPSVDVFCPPGLPLDAAETNSIAFSEQSELLVSYPHGWYLFARNMGLGGIPHNDIVAAELFLNKGFPQFYEGSNYGYMTFYGPDTDYVVGASLDNLLVWNKWNERLVRSIKTESAVSCILHHADKGMLFTGHVQGIVKYFVADAVKGAADGVKFLDVVNERRRPMPFPTFEDMENDEDEEEIMNEDDDMRELV